MRETYRRMITAIRRDEEHSLNRRAFLHLMFVCSVTFAAGAAPLATLARWAERSGSRRSPVRGGTPIARVNDIAPGQAMNFHFPTDKDPAVLLRLKNGDFVAYDRRCTHLLCPVLWDHARQELICPCHHGHFDPASGNPLAGPPRRPLPKIDVAVRDGTVYALGGRYRGVKTDGA